jgi:hypothetical protein
VGLCLGVGVGLGVAVGVPVTVAVGLAVGVTVAVAVAVDVAVAVAVAVAVGLAVGVGVGVPPPASGKTYAPRLRVQTESVVEPRSICMSHTIACGIPFSNRCQVGDATVMSSV